MARYKGSEAAKATKAYKDVASKHGISMAELALAFVKSRDFVTSTIIGATSMEQLKQNISAFDVELSKECLDDIDAVFNQYRDPVLLK